MENETLSEKTVPTAANFSVAARQPCGNGAKFCRFCGGIMAPMADRCPHCERTVARSGPDLTVMPIAGGAEQEESPDGAESPSFLALVSRLRARFFPADR
jgi:hypothetical protein